MTQEDAQGFLDRGHAQYHKFSGWQIAHVIQGELEWFTVNEQDGAIFDRLVGYGKEG